MGLVERDIASGALERKLGPISVEREGDWRGNVNEMRCGLVKRRRGKKIINAPTFLLSYGSTVVLNGTMNHASNVYWSTSIFVSMTFCDV